MPTTPDTLKQAAEEITQIIRKHDLAALVTLVAPGTVEHVVELSPSWSCARIQDTPQGKCLIIRAGIADYPDKAAQTEAVNKTLGMLLGMRHQAEMDFQVLDGTIAEATKRINLAYKITNVTEKEG